MATYSLRRVLFTPLAALLLLLPAMLLGLYRFHHSTLESAAQRHATEVADNAADFISLVYGQVAQNFARMGPLATQTHLEVNRRLPDTIEAVDVEALAAAVRADLPPDLHMDLAVVTPGLVIRDTTYTPEKGLDLGNFADAVADFGQARASASPVLSFPVVEAVGAHVRLYSQLLAPSGNYFTQMALYDAESDRLFKRMRERLSGHNALQNADLFLFSGGGRPDLTHVFTFTADVATPADEAGAATLAAVRKLAAAGADTVVPAGSPDDGKLEFYRRVAVDPTLVGALPFGAVVRVSVDTSTHGRVFAAHRAVILVMLSLILGAIVFAALFLRQSFEEPVLELARHVDKGEPVPAGSSVRRASELAMIGDRFNGHLSRIEKSEAELRALYERTEQLVEERTADVQALSRRLLVVQEEQLRRISLELHDEFGQSLVGMRLMLHSLVNRLPPDGPNGCAEILASCETTLERALSQVRHLTEILRPSILDIAGLAGALQWLGRQYGDGVDLRVSVGNVPDGLDDRIAVATFRIAQEAISNAVKHSGANAVEVALSADATGRLELTVTDEGAGFRPDTMTVGEGGRTRLGLESMRERARLSGGQLEIHSAPGSGTRIVAVWDADEPATM